MVKAIRIFLDGDHYYSPGSLVQGKVMVSVDKPKKYNSIVITLWGRAKVRWTENHGAGEHQQVVTYSNEDTFIHVQATLWKVEDSPTGDLPIGEHYFPFAFQLPQNSFPSFVGRFGQIQYELTAKSAERPLETQPYQWYSSS